jgi:hypothetical protein
MEGKLMLKSMLLEHNTNSIIRSVKTKCYLQEVDKIIETLRNSGMEFVLATMKELQLATLNVLPFVYIL